jgi:hypothetical protein
VLLPMAFVVSACGNEEQAVGGGKPISDCDYARRVQSAEESFALAVITAANGGAATGPAAVPVYEAFDADLAKIEDDLRGARLGVELDALNEQLIAFMENARKQAGVMKKATTEGDRTPVSVMLEKWQNDFVDRMDRLSQEQPNAVKRLDQCALK